MVSADDPFSTPMAPPAQRRLRSTCTPPRKPSAKIMRVMLSESPDNIYSILTRRTSRSAKRALPFSQGITTPPPSSAKSRNAVLASLRGRAAAVRLNFDNIKASPSPTKACDGEQQVKMQPPAGSVTPPPLVAPKRVKRRKHGPQQAVKAAAENTTPPRGDHPQVAKEGTQRVTRSTALASKPSVHGRVRRLWR